MPSISAPASSGLLNAAAVFRLEDQFRFMLWWTSQGIRHIEFVHGVSCGFRPSRKSAESDARAVASLLEVEDSEGFEMSGIGTYAELGKAIQAEDFVPYTTSRVDPQGRAAYALDLWDSEDESPRPTPLDVSEEWSFLSVRRPSFGPPPKPLGQRRGNSTPAKGRKPVSPNRPTQPRIRPPANPGTSEPQS